MWIKQEQLRVAVGPKTAVIHFWSPGGVRRRPQRVASNSATATAVVPAAAAIAVAAAALGLLQLLLCGQFSDEKLSFIN